MTDTTTTPTVTVPDEIVEEDKALAADAKRSDMTAKTAKERRADAFTALNQFRWEMTVCEFGPQFPQKVYGDAVGQTHRTIGNGAAAWQNVLDASESGTDYPICSFGGSPHHIPEVVTPEITPPSQSQVDQHDEQRRIVDAGEIKAAAIEMLAAHFGLSATTVEVNYRPLVNEAVTRLRDAHDVGEMTIVEIQPLLNNIALILRQEDKLRSRREDEVRRWMATNRGLAASEIKIADVRSKMERIDKVATQKGLSWAQAATEVREMDVKSSAAAKLKNETARAARMAILDLMQAANDVKSAAMAVIKAVSAIEDADIAVTDDERDISVEDLNSAEAAIHLARAALTGESGTDWDAAKTALLAQEGGE